MREALGSIPKRFAPSDASESEEKHQRHVSSTNASDPTSESHNNVTRWWRRIPAIGKS